MFLTHFTEAQVVILANLVTFPFCSFTQILNILTKNLQSPGTKFFIVPGKQPALLIRQLEDKNSLKDIHGKA